MLYLRIYDATTKKITECSTSCVVIEHNKVYFYPDEGPEEHVELTDKMNVFVSE